LKTAGFKTLKG